MPCVSSAPRLRRSAFFCFIALERFLERCVAQGFFGTVFVHFVVASSELFERCASCVRWLRPGLQQTLCTVIKLRRACDVHEQSTYYQHVVKTKTHHEVK